MGKVKAQLIDLAYEPANDYEPDMGDYAQEKYENIFYEGIYCHDCEHSQITQDGYGTGDSPPLRECMIYEVKNCPGLLEN